MFLMPIPILAKIHNILWKSFVFVTIFAKILNSFVNIFAKKEINLLQTFSLLILISELFVTVNKKKKVSVWYLKKTICVGSQSESLTVKQCTQFGRPVTGETCKCSRLSVTEFILLCLEVIKETIFYALPNVH
jgi:hypothetical protein